MRDPVIALIIDFEHICTLCTSHRSILKYNLVAKAALSGSHTVKAWMISTKAPTVASM